MIITITTLITRLYVCVCLLAQPKMCSSNALTNELYVGIDIITFGCTEEQLLNVV